MIRALLLLLWADVGLAGPICYPCQSRVTIYDVDFSHVPVSLFEGNDRRWDVSGDGTTNLTNKGLGFSSIPYTIWSATPNAYYQDHDKATLTLYSPTFDDTHFYVEVKLTGRTFGTENHPFPDDMVHENDLRLANCGISLSKSYNNFGSYQFMLLLTNDRIYAVWEVRNRFPSLGTPVYGGLLAKPIARRCPEQCHKLAIEVFPGFALLKSKVWVDGKCVGAPFAEFATNQTAEWMVIFNQQIFITEDSDVPIYITRPQNLP